MPPQNLHPQSFQEGTDLSKWFDDYVRDIRIDQAILESGSASNVLKNTYGVLFNDNPEQIVSEVRKMSSKYIISSVLQMYVDEIAGMQKMPKSLALDLSDSKILVWAEIGEDDEVMEGQLIMAEAKINAAFEHRGMHISTMIVEDADGFEIPAHYQPLTLRIKK